MKVSVRGACHCGRVAFEVAQAAPQYAYVCNCSICVMKGYLHWFVAKDDFRLLKGRDDLSTYTFNTHQAKHYFCKHCGVAPFYVARSHPDKFDVNLRCIESIDIDELERRDFDGKNWEQSIEKLAAEEP